MPVPAAAASTASGDAEDYEVEHVHHVYQEIASHFSATRFKVCRLNIFFALKYSMRRALQIRRAKEASETDVLNAIVSETNRTRCRSLGLLSRGFYASCPLVLSGWTWAVGMENT
jgi:hypothetical protein